MNYDLLWSMDEYQSVVDYKFNSFKYINMFLNEDVTNRERNFKPNAKALPKTSEEFIKAIETITNLYEAIQKNYVLNGCKQYPQKLFRGVRKNSNHPYFTSTSESLEMVLSNFIDGINNEDISNDVLLEVEPSNVAWIDLEAYIPYYLSRDLNEKEILFIPCEYQTKQEMTFGEYLSNNDISLPRNMGRRFDKIKDLTCRKVSLVAPSYKFFAYMSLDALATRFEQYRQNLIKLTEAVKNGLPTTQIEKDIVEFKKFCSGYLKSQFNKIDIELQRHNQTSLKEQIQIDRNSTIQEVHVGNTGRMFFIKSPDSAREYYFKPAESKDGVAKPYRAYIQEAAYNVQRIINPARAVKCNAININGTFGAVQEKVEVDKDATRQFHRYFYGNGGKLDPKLLSQILDEYLVDYCLCNYDANAQNFVIDSNGNLRGIDKEQSFRYIEKDATDDMLFSKNYNEEYGESETIYATIFKKIASGEISHNVLEGLNYRAARLAQIPDEQYRELFKKYAYGKTNNQQDAEMLLDRITARKKEITKKVDLLKQDMFQKSDGKVKETDEYIFTDKIIQEQKSLDINQKEELIKEKQDLRRIKFQQRTKQIGLEQQQVPNLNTVFQKQEHNQQASNQREEEHNHGMSM